MSGDASHCASLRGRRVNPEGIDEVARYFPSLQPLCVYFPGPKSFFLHCFLLEELCPNWTVCAHEKYSRTHNCESNCENCYDATCVRAFLVGVLLGGSLDCLLILWPGES